MTKSEGERSLIGSAFLRELPPSPPFLPPTRQFLSQPGPNPSAFPTSRSSWFEQSSSSSVARAAKAHYEEWVSRKEGKT